MRRERGEHLFLAPFSLLGPFSSPSCRCRFRLQPVDLALGRGPSLARTASLDSPFSSSRHFEEVAARNAERIREKQALYLHVTSFMRSCYNGR